MSEEPKPNLFARLVVVGGAFKLLHDGTTKEAAPPVLSEYVCTRYGNIVNGTVDCLQWAWLTWPQNKDIPALRSVTSGTDENGFAKNLVIP